MEFLVLVFIILFVTNRSRYFNIYWLGLILFAFINVILNKTFFAPIDNLDIAFFLNALFIFAFIPLVLLALSVFTFFNSKILMEKEGRKVRNLFISLIGLASLSILLLSMYLYFSESYSNTVTVIYAWVIGLFIYFMGMFTSTAVYAWIYHIFPPAKKPQYIIVLGSGLIGDRVPPLLASRLDKAVQQFKKHDERPLLITSGGQGSDELVAEADAMKKYIVETHGIDPNKILSENKSTTTYENMLFSKRIIDQHIEHAHGIFVTNNFHVLRASFYAKKVNLQAIGVGSKTAFYYVPNAFMREFIGLLEMYKWWHIMCVLGFTLIMGLLLISYL